MSLDPIHPLFQPLLSSLLLGLLGWRLLRRSTTGSPSRIHRAFPSRVPFDHLKSDGTWLAETFPLSMLSISSDYYLWSLWAQDNQNLSAWRYGRSKKFGLQLNDIVLVHCASVTTAYPPLRVILSRASQARDEFMHHWARRNSDLHGIMTSIQLLPVFH